MQELNSLTLNLYLQISLGAAFHMVMSSCNSCPPFQHSVPFHQNDPLGCNKYIFFLCFFLGFTIKLESNSFGSTSKPLPPPLILLHSISNLLAKRENGPTGLRLSLPDTAVSSSNPITRSWLWPTWEAVRTRGLHHNPLSHPAQNPRTCMPHITAWLPNPAATLILSLNIWWIVNSCSKRYCQNSDRSSKYTLEKKCRFN